MKHGPLLNKLGIVLFSTLLGATPLLIGNSANAQTKKTQEAAKSVISGVIRDSLKNPIGGASIFVKGANTGVRSTDNGTFSLNASPNATLVITNIGYKTNEIALNGRTQITVELTGALNVLNEVVVTGYQTISKDQATGTFQTLSGPQLQQRPTPNLLDKLEGSAAGVSVTRGEYGIVSL